MLWIIVKDITRHSNPLSEYWKLLSRCMHINFKEHKACVIGTLWHIVAMIIKILIMKIGATTVLKG